MSLPDIYRTAPAGGPVEDYRSAVVEEFAVGEGVGLRRARAAVAEGGLPADQRRLVDYLDTLVLDGLLGGDYIADYLLQDDAAQPASAWWWHLAAIRKGEWDVADLPPHLAAIYPANRPAK